ncbi:MAG: HNH endonuclease [Deltaproteobacteria bacterium]
MGRPCPKCGSEDFRPAPDKERGCYCNWCGAFWWQPKPENEKAKRPSKHRELAKKYGQGFCELCMRPEQSLPGPQVLEGHHVVEYEDGGTDERTNVWVICTPCHIHVHHLRTYLGHYQSRSEEDAA